MADILSQSEIDALLSAISTGEMDADELKKEESKKKEKVYDFKRALRFSKDQVRSITRIHENYSRLLTTLFSAQLRTYVEFAVASVDQLPYEEFIRSVPSMTMLNIFEAPPLEGRLLIEVNPNIAYAMVDRVLGGLGTSLNKIDRLTEIETKIISQLFEKALTVYSEAWESVIDIDPVLNELEINPQFLQLVSPNETVIVISLSTTIGEASGMMNICLPHVVLEPIIKKLSVHYWMQEKTKNDRDPVDTSLLKNSLKQAELDLCVLLGESDLSIEDFLELDVDDVIRLDQVINDPILLKVSNEPKFEVQPGVKNRNIAVQILNTITKGEDQDD